MIVWLATAPDPSTAVTDADRDLWVALLGALVGATLAIAGEFVLRWWSDRRRYRDLFDLLKGEVDYILGDSTKRYADPPPGVVPVREPLPSTAWHMMIQSGLSRRLGPFLGPITEFYRVVDWANGMAAQALALQMASIASGDLGGWLHEEARRLATEPFSKVSELASQLSERLESA